MLSRIRSFFACATIVITALIVVDRFPGSLATNARAAASSTTVRFAPQDTSLNIDTINYSGSAILTIYTWPDNTIANAILLKFDLAALPQDAIIEDATLHLALVESDTSAAATYTVTAHKIVGKNPVMSAVTGYTVDGVNAWTANPCCHDNVPLAQGDISLAYDTRVIDKSAGLKPWTLTAMVREWLADPATNFGVLLNSDPAALRDRYRFFASMEHADATLRPYLQVTYSLPVRDVTPPTVWITAPGAGTPVTGSVNVTANATDDIGVAGVQFQLDGRPLGAEVTTSPYAMSWDSTLATDGAHTLTAVARDAAGNSRVAAGVSVTTANGRLVLSPQDTTLNLNANSYSTFEQLLTYTWPDYRVANAILMKFDLSAIPPGAVVQEATLHMSLLESDAAPEGTYTITAHKVTGKNPVIPAATGYSFDGAAGWTPSTCCHDNVPLAQGDISLAYDTRPVDKAPGDKTWTITAMVQEWLADPTSNFGLLLNSDATALRDRYRNFASMEHPDATLRPSLHITYARQTQDVIPPQVSAIAASGITASAATIAWTTNELSDSQVEYGLTTSYGSVTPLDATAVTSHRVALSGLTDTTLYHFRVRSRDAAGNVAVSADSTFKTRDGKAPTVSINAPAAGATVSGTVTVSAVASDNVGVTSVQFKLDGVNLGASDTTAPYSVSWNTVNVANGSHVLKAVARDAAGNSRTSVGITVTVANGTLVGDVTAPTVSVTAPASGATVSGTVAVSGNASDNVGVVGVQFKLDGANLGTEDTTSPYSISWSTTAVTNGSHTLTAIARDAAGNQSTSSSVSLTVSNGSPTVPPSGWSHEPAGFVQVNNQPWDALSSAGWSHANRGAQSRIVADATAPLSASNVLEHVYPVGMAGGVEPAVDWYSLPAGFTEGFVGVWWKASNPWQGHSSHVNKIFFLFGSQGHLIPIMYGPPGGPYELRVAPEYGNWSWLTPNVTNVAVTLGTWHKIELYFKQVGSTVTVRWWMDGTEIGNYTNVPFSGSLQELQVAPTWGGVGGTKSQNDYFRYDHIYFSKPGSGTTTPPADTTPPTVSLTAPAGGSTVSGSAVTVSASASDTVGVAGVQFTLDGVNLGAEDTTAPYATSWNTTATTNGSHTLRAVARDAAGNRTTSAATTVTVSNTTTPPPPTGGTILFQEAFEDASLTSRGWYDNTTPLLSTAEHVANSTRSIEFKFNAGAMTPTAATTLRKKFTPSDSVYLSYYVKYSSNWVGSQRTYHPHEFHFLTNLDGDWSGLSFTRLTAYIEQNGGTPLMGIQDGANVDQSRVGQNLTTVTENRGVAGCNGSSDGYPDNCYLGGSGYVNEKKWKAASRLFGDTPGPYYKNDWHLVEAYIKLNTISGGKGVNDGVVQYWFDGQLVIDRRNVLLRTGANATMKFNQFIIAPYIGDGSPVTQSMWVDNLTVATGRP